MFNNLQYKLMDLKHRFKIYKVNSSNLKHKEINVINKSQV